MELSPGHILRGRYRIIELVGKGGMGYVYRAEDTKNNYRTVAIKEMIQQNLSNSELRKAQERFQHEADLLQNLSHPNLPKVHESFIEQGHSYLVMDFIEGQNLADLLAVRANRKLPIGTVIEYGIALCHVLEYLHSRPQAIIYRDLKPANVMVTDNGHVYLVDFGVARVFKPGQSMDTERFVTPGFCPPEQLLSDEQTDVRSDLYSLGATLYYCLTGRNPKDNKPTMFNFAPLSSQEAPPRLNYLLLNLVATDKDKRPANIQVVLQDLMRIKIDALGTTISANGITNTTGYYYDQRMAQQAQVQMQVRMWLNNLPLLARRGWSNLYPVLLNAGTNVWSWLVISFIPFCMGIARKIHTVLPTWSRGHVSLKGLFPAGIPLLAITGIGSLYLLNGQHNPLLMVILALCLLFTLMGFNATFQQALPLPARYGLAGATALAFLSCLILAAQPDIQAQLMRGTISNFLSLILIALALASLLRKNTQQFWLDHLAVVACTLACGVLAYNAALSFSGLGDGVPSPATIMTISLFGTIAFLELLSYRARFSSWSWFLVAIVVIGYTIASCVNLQEIIRTFPSRITTSSDMSVADSLKVLLVLLLAFVPLITAALARWSPARSSITRLVIPALALGCVVQLQQLAQGLSLLNFSARGRIYTVASSMHDVFSPNQFVAIALILLTLWLFVGLFANPRQAQLDYVGLLSVGIVFILFQRSIPKSDITSAFPIFTGISISLTFLSYIMPAIILLLIISVICLFILLVASSTLHATINSIRLSALVKWMGPAQPGFGHLILFLCTTVSLWLQWFFSRAEPLYDVSLIGQTQVFTVAQLLFFVSLFLWIISIILFLRSSKNTNHQKKSTFSAMARIILCYNALLAALLLFNMHELGPLSVQDTLQWLGIASIPTSPFLINVGLLLAAFLLFITASTLSYPNIAPTARILAGGALIFAVLQFFWPPLALITFILLMQHIRFITVTAASMP